MTMADRFLRSKLWLFVVIVALFACGPGSNRVSEKPISSAALPAMAGSSAMPSTPPLGPPTAKDVQDAVHRVFSDDVLLLDHENPRFVIGDFNGDSSLDLIVPVKVSPAKLAEINNELANWTIDNPRTTYIAPQHQKVVTLPPVPKPEQARAGETLLAIIHGYGSAGWRNSMARQAYLLREAAGSSPRVEQPSQSLLHDFGLFPSPRQVLAEDLGGKHGVLYWTGATYAWHSER
jgi:hypothetical protein